MSTHSACLKNPEKSLLCVQCAHVQRDQIICGQHVQARAMQVADGIVIKIGD